MRRSDVLPGVKRTPFFSRWTSAVRTDSFDDKARSLANELALPLPLGRLLIARGYDDASRAKQFLRPQIDQLHPPAVLKDLSKAAARLADAIKSNETILVHGDYDVDGMCSTALMTRAIRALGGTVVPFIPDRRADGYDLGPAGVAACCSRRARGTDLRLWHDRSHRRGRVEGRWDRSDHFRSPPAERPASGCIRGNQPAPSRRRIAR